MPRLVAAHAIRIAALVGCLAGPQALEAGAPAGAWPQHRGDAGRSGYAPAPLPTPLALAWRRRLPHAAQPAWPRSQRLQFDWTPQPVVAGGLVLVGHSADHTLRAIDLRTGRLRWRLVTDAPIRVAPAVWRDRVFVGSDDGCFYAVSLADGRLLSRRRPFPNDRWVLGNERLISRWPIRGGPVVADDVVYYAAGIWPSEGVAFEALRADTGQLIWRQDGLGRLEMPQPHPGAEARSGPAAQGHLVVSGDLLLVPTGRAVPAALDRRTGELRYFHLQQYGRQGGADVMAVGGWAFNGGLAFRVADGAKTAQLGPGPLAATADGVVQLSDGRLVAYRWAEQQAVDRRGRPLNARTLVPAERIDGVGGGAALAVAGGQAIVGGEGAVAVWDLAAGRRLGSHAVDGSARGLAVAQGRLVVVTDAGWIYCFAAAPVDVPRDWGPDAGPSGYGENRLAAEAAERVIDTTGVDAGYCVDLGCGDGALACELARRSALRIWAVEDDPELAERARRRARAAGLYGVRVTVHERPPAQTGYPDAVADLVVSQRSLSGSWSEAAAAEAARIVRPEGGVVCWGPPEAMRRRRRGPLPGAGRWTHQYADAANTLCSGDAILRSPLTMRWFRDVDFPLAQRHGRPPGPLYDGGRLYHQGLNGVVCLNAYNGQELWRREIPGLLSAYDGDELMGTAGVGGNWCLGGGSLYVRHENRCLRLDAATGRLVAEFSTPPDAQGRSAPWGYIAYADGVLFGGAADPEHVVTYRYRSTTGDMTRLLTEARSLFAVDARSGRLLWRYDAAHSIRHNAIAVAAGKVFLIDRPQALFDREKSPEVKEHPPGRLAALDAKTGRVVWSCDEAVYGTLLAASERLGVLLMSYQPTRFRLDSERGGRMAAFALEDGRRLWDVEADYQSRPMLIGDAVYAQGGAWDLRTGRPLPFPFRRSYGCGILAASTRLLVFRSATLGYYDLCGPGRTENYGGVRPGCWINAVPAGGLVLMPDATAGCTCSYLNRAWLALAPAE